MGLNFRKRVSILPGLTLNFGKRGTSVTVGKRGASLNFSKRGTYANVGIPGTGISYREQLSKPNSAANRSRKKYSSPTATGSYSSSSATYSNNYADNMTEKQSSATMWVLLFVLLGGAIACYIKCFCSGFSSPGILLFAYTLASLLFSFGSLALGFTINASRKKGSRLPVNLAASAILISAITFLIWSNFWPSIAESYRTVWGHKVMEIIDLDGWKSFGNGVSWVAIVISLIIFFINNFNNQSENN